MTFCEYDATELPEPSDEPPDTGAREPNVSLQLPGFVVAYRKYPVVAARFGLPEPFSVAVVEVTLVAATVVAVAGAAVVNDSTDPSAVPSVLCTMAQ